MKTLKFLTFVTVIMVFTAVAGTFLELNNSRFYKLGSSVRDFMLKDIQGGFVSLSDYKKAKGFILVFTSSHCPYAKNVNEAVEQLSKTYLQLDYPVIVIDPTISSDDIFKKFRRKLAKQNQIYPYLIDEQQRVASRFGIAKVPSACILSKENGFLVLKYRGAIDKFSPQTTASNHQNYISQKMQVLLRGGELKVTHNNPTGCQLRY